jgi:IstB-like ATP binding protein
VNATAHSSILSGTAGKALTNCSPSARAIFSGKPGRGKTHLGVAIAYRAIQNGFDALLHHCGDAHRRSLSGVSSRAARAGPARLHASCGPRGRRGGLSHVRHRNMLFHVVNERHRRHRSMIFTTNKALKAWGRVLHDEDLGQAIIDRVLERGRLIRLDGPSIRTLHLKLDDALKDESDQDDEVARIPGIKWPEFPEPTRAAASWSRTPCLNELQRARVSIWRRQFSAFVIEGASASTSTRLCSLAPRHIR